MIVFDLAVMLRRIMKTDCASLSPGTEAKACGIQLDAVANNAVTASGSGACLACRVRGLILDPGSHTWCCGSGAFH